jgi:hypothetical protein
MRGVMPPFPIHSHDVLKVSAGYVFMAWHRVNLTFHNYVSVSVCVCARARVCGGEGGWPLTVTLSAVERGSSVKYQLLTDSHEAGAGKRIVR